MLKKIITIVALLALALIVIIAAQPAEFRITRSLTMSAPADKVFAEINDLRQWQHWSPWAKIDPKASTTYEGPAAGLGAAMSWHSKNEEVGSGKMTITESRAYELIKFRLDFQEPFTGTSNAEFVLSSEGNATRVAWSMSGKNNFIAKAFSLLMDCDAMVGAQFERGLNSIKAIVESK